MAKTTSMVMNTRGNKKFQNDVALLFLNGCKAGIAKSNNIQIPIIPSTRASYLKPKINAEPEKAFPGGLKRK